MQHGRGRSSTSGSASSAGGAGGGGGNAAADTTAGGQQEAPYYWESGGDTNAPITTVVAHNLHWLAHTVVGTVEYVGEFFADFFGLYNSRYEWAVDMQRRRIVRPCSGPR